MIKDILQLCIDRGLGGKDTDTCIKAGAVNILKPDRPVITIPMNLPEVLKNMMHEADSVHTFIEAGIFHFNAVYSFDKKFPATRIYFIKTDNLISAARLSGYLHGSSSNFRPANGSMLANLIMEKDYPIRYEEWRKAFSARYDVLNRFVDGRIENTSIEKGIFLASDGKCLFCDEKTSLMSSMSIIGKTGLMICIQLCSNHQHEAESHATLIEYVAKKAGISLPFLIDASTTLHDKDVIAMSAEAIQNILGCIIEKVYENTITAIRKSGVRLIVRQEGLSNYAYVIKDPGGHVVSRIDSANHHNVEFGPDHTHKFFGENESGTIEPSFTYGFAVVDLKAIQKLIEDVERRWGVAAIN